MGCCQASKRSAKQAGKEDNTSDAAGLLRSHAAEGDAETNNAASEEFGPTLSVATDGLSLPTLGDNGDGEPGKVVMDKFVMLTGEDDIMGEGSFSICRKGIQLSTGEVVAIKTFKDDNGDAETKAIQLQKFKKQIQVLEDLAKPLKQPQDDSLWCPQLENVCSEDLFMKLVDYTKESSGEPGPQPSDGILYLVTELASYSLDDYLYEQYELGQPLSRHAVQELSRAVLLVIAGLHTKGLCHLDLKPENLMLFSSRMKLIDVDGCVSIGARVALGDASVSFSPAFCAPEWAAWMTTDADSDWIDVLPSLDVWSVGMTLCQLITLDVVLEEKYAEFSGKNARCEFLSWLGGLQEPPVPQDVLDFDAGFADLLNRLLICDKAHRKSIASCLSCSFVASSERADNRVILLDDEEIDPMDPSSREIRIVRKEGELLKEDLSLGEPVLKATIWQLNADGEVDEIDSWIKCDMWLTTDGDFCFYDLRQRKRLIYMDKDELSTAKLVTGKPCVRGQGLELCTSITGGTPARLAFDDKQTLNQWYAALKDPLKTISKHNSAQPGTGLRLECRNRREPIPSSSKREYEPVFRTVLWKLKQGANGKRKDHWFARETWIAVNFNLVYYSVKDEKDLIYYSHQDLELATVVRIPPGEVLMPWSFQLVIPPQGGVVFAPAVFAAVSQEARERWIQEFQIQQVRISGMYHGRATILRDIYQTDGGPAIMEKAVRGDARQLQELADASMATRREPEAEPASSVMTGQPEEDKDEDEHEALNGEKEKKGKAKKKARGKTTAKKGQNAPQDAKKIPVSGAPTGDTKHATGKPATGKNAVAKKQGLE